MKTSILAVALMLGLSACAPRLVEKLPYYKMPVVQGVQLDSRAVLAVQPGMTREQVQMEIGAPVLRPSFRADRWDYVYEVGKGGKVREQRNLTVFFQGDTVARVEGSALDAAREELGRQPAKQPENASAPVQGQAK